MKWYSAKKHKPTQYCSCLLLRLESSNGFWFLTGVLDANPRNFLMSSLKPLTDASILSLNAFCLA
jgi:hypothetical protein